MHNYGYALHHQSTNYQGQVLNTYSSKIDIYSY